MFVWLFHVGRYCSPAVDIIVLDTHDQFPLGRAHPLQVVFRWWFMLLTGSFWSPLVTCKDVAGSAFCFPWQSEMPHIFTPPTPLPPRRYMYNVTCKRSNIMWKKKNVCTVLGISSSGLGFERRLVTVEASIYKAHCCFLSVLHWSATGVSFSLRSSSTCRSLRAKSTSNPCPQCEDVHSSATLFAIVAERMQRSTVSLHHEQHLCLRWVTLSPSGKNNECIKRRPFPSTLYYHTLFFNVLPRWLWELECFLRFSMNDSFALPFRLGDRRKSFLPLDWHCSSGLKALFWREKNSSASDLSWPSTWLEQLRRIGWRASASTLASFRPKSIATRTIASPQRAFFPWQLGVRKFTDLPDCGKQLVC